MNSHRDFPDTLMVSYRSEAFAEDLEEHRAPQRPALSTRLRTWSPWALWLCMAPLALALLGSATALSGA